MYTAHLGHVLLHLARAYIKFAREERHLYEILMLPTLGLGKCSAHRKLWLFVVNQVARLSGLSQAREAAIALWAFLHGMTALEAAKVFGEEKPASSFEFGLNSWLAAVSRIEAQQVGRSVPDRRRSTKVAPLVCKLHESA